MDFKKLIEDFQRHCEVSAPLECCGIITTDFEYVRCKNISNSPKESFVMDYASLMKYDGKIFALCHSHPDDLPSTPSSEDIHDPILSKYKFVVGNTKNVYIYWLL